jgi:hypothetical protein
MVLALLESSSTGVEGVATMLLAAAVLLLQVSVFLPLTGTAVLLLTTAADSLLLLTVTVSSLLLLTTTAVSLLLLTTPAVTWLAMVEG